MKPSTLRILAALAVGLSPRAAVADLSLQNFAYTAQDATVTYTVEACDSGSMTGSASLGLYYSPGKTPTVGMTPDQSQSVYATATCSKTTLVRQNAPVGLYLSYAFIDFSGIVIESNEQNNVAGPLEVCVGPDVYLKSFDVEKNGAAVTYKATVCNQGSMDAKKFRVGFWHDKSAAPASSDMGDIFKGITVLAAGKCEDLVVSGGLRPNGSFTAWARADSGDFVTECRETNNPLGPKAYTMANPDLAISAFEAKVSGQTVTYSIKVCNKGVVAVTKFYVDLYYHRAKQAPVLGEPGDVVQSVLSLNPSGCVSLTFTRSGTSNGTYQSYAMADSDDFVSEPNEANNISSALSVQVGSGATGSCTDSDTDGYGLGSGCKGVPDCNDQNAKISPKEKEICGDKIDQDCDLTADDGCPGVDCTDKDGDSFGTGKDCVLADCDDSNALVYPWATETCGNNKDDNCNKIVDDGCAGVNCTDADMDGYGTGSGCKGVPDCDDSDRLVNPGAKEVCGNKIDEDCDLTADDGCPGVDCTDKDGDSFGTGKDCVLADCDDANKAVYPFAPEVCGDNKDDNCNKIADDGCPGRQCTDADADGYGVGKGCPGPQDCKDTDFQVNPGAKEVCGDGLDNDCDLVPDDGCTTATDSDGDGYSVGKTTGQPDCNDSDKTIYPGAKEVCGDGIDNDCDSTVDDGCSGVLCTDGDGDGWGIGSDCKIPDCNDKDSSVFPWAAESCSDSVDNNCNGTINEGCTGVACTDGDGDTFGTGTGCCNDATAQATCKRDCNDTDGGVHPWQKEICADGKDNDCDSSIDEGCVLCEDKDGDGYGIGPKCSSWDCDETRASAFLGAPEVCDGKDDNCNGIVDDDCAGGDEGCSCEVRPWPVGSSALFWLLCLLPLVLFRRRT